jgi:hypothetical protein
MHPESTVFRYTVLIAAAVLQAVIVARGIAFLLENFVVSVASSMFARGGQPPAYFWDFAARTAAGVTVFVLLVIAVRMMVAPAAITLSPRALVAAAIFAGAIIVVASGLSDVAGVVGRMISTPSAGIGGISEAFGAVVRTVIIGGLFAVAGFVVRPKAPAAPAAVPTS